MNFKSILKGNGKPVWIRFALIIGFFTILTRVILDSRFAESALLYILVPYLVAISLYIYLPLPQGLSRIARFIKHMALALIVMLATSAFLFEGFICVLMFLPIYMFFAAIGFALSRNQIPEKPDFEDIFKISVTPVIVILLSLEGVSSFTSFKRFETVSHTQLVDLDIAAIKHNLSSPIHLDEGRSAFLSVFPLPDRVEAGSLNPGDIHKTYFTYKRWGFTNVHKGETWVRLAEVNDRFIRTEIVKDTSYFSKYLTVSGTEIAFEPVNEAQTQVTLTIRYKRLLDPVWYFGPLQKRAMNESAEYLVNTVIAKPGEP